MKLIATLFKGKTIEWKIRISPRNVKTKYNKSNNTVISDTDVIRRWAPDENKENDMLIYDPIIYLSGKGFFDADTRISIPVNLFYTFVGVLGQAYNKLSTKGLYNVIDNDVVIDKNIAQSVSIKLPTPWSFVIITPTLLYPRNSAPVKGVLFFSGNAQIGTMDASELRAFYEQLNKIDISTFSLAVSILESFDKLDQKLDKVIDTQDKMLQLLMKNTKNGRGLS